MVIDWDDLSIMPQVRALAELVRLEFGLTVGLLDGEGRAWILGESVSLKREVPAAFEAHPIRDEHGLLTSARARHEWVETIRSRRVEHLETRSYTGLSALVVPLHSGEGDDVLLGAVYASDYVPAESASTALAIVRQQGAKLHLDIADEAFDAVVQLTRTQRHLVRGILRKIAQEIGQRLVALESRVDTVGAATSFSGMIGASAGMLKVFRTIEKVARSNSTVLVLGENGTGKELIARALHQRSRRRYDPFVVQNVAAIPPDLIESELFGHVRGSFSGAHRDRRGLFEIADGGTFFLDEMGEMPVNLQVKLLRVLQEGSFLPVGGSVFRKVDVRVICATNRDLRAMVARGEFREDLYYRINVIHVTAPPLRQRRDDIPVLIEHFLSRAARMHGGPRKTLSERAMQRMVGYSWPGNVRELENEIERMVILSGEDEVLELHHISDRVFQVESRDEVRLESQEETLPEVITRIERQMILASLRRTGWNKTRSARELGVSRRNLIRKVAQYELEELHD